MGCSAWGLNRLKVRCQEDCVLILSLGVSFKLIQVVGKIQFQETVGFEILFCCCCCWSFFCFFCVFFFPSHHSDLFSTTRICLNYQSGWTSRRIILFCYEEVIDNIMLLFHHFCHLDLVYPQNSSSL